MQGGEAERQEELRAHSWRQILPRRPRPGADQLPDAREDAGALPKEAVDVAPVPCHHLHVLPADLGAQK
eukprot:329766-Pyramimonas_sp.AAC.1